LNYFKATALDPDGTLGQIFDELENANRKFKDDLLSRYKELNR